MEREVGLRYRLGKTLTSSIGSSKASAAHPKLAESPSPELSCHGWSPTQADPGKARPQAKWPLWPEADWKKDERQNLPSDHTPVTAH